MSSMVCLSIWSVDTCGSWGRDPPQKEAILEGISQAIASTGNMQHVVDILNLIWKVAAATWPIAHSAQCRHLLDIDHMRDITCTLQWARKCPQN